MKISKMLLTGLMIISSAWLFGQSKTVTGTVTAEDTGETLPGATVVVEGTNNGVVSDIDGKFSIETEVGKVLVVSFIGMQDKKITVGEANNYTVQLLTGINLDEFVVTALGITREEKSVGYAVQRVSNKEIKMTGNADLTGALAGKLSGVDIRPSSGMPGASSQLVIRGARSFTGNNTPLYVVDGMPISTTPAYSTGNSVTGTDVGNRGLDINPADIVSIDVLKGQAAAALYGIRGSNGVILITTRRGKGLDVGAGKPVISFSHNSTFDQVSRTPDYQTTYAQGSYGKYLPTSSFSWGPKITDLPNDPTYGGNTSNAYTTEYGQRPGQFYVPQRAQAGIDPWATPTVYNNWDDYFETGYTSSNNLSIAQATENGNYSIGFGITDQTGIALGTGMTRYNAKIAGDRKVNKNFTVGYSANFSKSDVDKLSGGNDGSLTGPLAAPASYDLKGTPNHYPGDPYRQIYYRGGSFDNSYWIPGNNTFNEKTDRFFGNAYVNYAANLGDGLDLNIRYQGGADSYTTHLQDIFGYGSRGNSKGTINNYGLTKFTFNSLTTADLGWRINDDFRLDVLVGNELNNTTNKGYDENGTDFNFGGWNHIGNANIQTANESQSANRDVGFFGNVALSWKSMLYLSATGRNDIVSSMPSDNRSFFYPSVSLSFVISELEGLQDYSWLSFAKVRGSYAQVGQAGTYYENFFTTPNYGGGFWLSDPIQYPINGLNSYIPSTTQYDPNLRPQNTESYEVGIDLKFFDDRLGIDYTYSNQNVTDQIFAVPLAGSTGATELVMNGGAIETKAHELSVYITPIMNKDFRWDIGFNYTAIDNQVIELADGVESIFLGGFVTPQVRAGIGNSFPVIYGTSFARNSNGDILVVDNPGAWNHGMPQSGDPKVIGEASPKFILGGSTSFNYKNITLSAVLEWKNGGEMYSGSNGLIDLYGRSQVTEDRNATFIYDGVKPDGTPNDIVRGGSEDPDALQDLYTNVLTDIDEYFIHENSFVKLRELALGYQFPKPVYKTLTVGLSLYARNILIWTALRNMDPESSQGNTNMGGSFERFSLPQTTSFGFGVNLTF